jgi:hypothetical protein
MRIDGWSGAGVLIFALCASNAFSDPVYRWVDANGVVNYSTKAPPSGSAAALTVRSVDLSESLASHDSEQVREARRAREQSEAAQLTAAREERLRLELLEQRIAAERARTALIGSQSGYGSDRGAADCDADFVYADSGCTYPVAFVGARRRNWRSDHERARHPRPPGPERAVGVHRLS